MRSAFRGVENRLRRTVFLPASLGRRGENRGRAEFLVGRKKLEGRGLARRG